MPNCNTHIELASTILERVSHPVLRENPGFFLIGSTAPDIRIITRARREQYHFATLDFYSVGEGVRGLFSARPDLGSPSNLSGATAAFLSGFLTHIIADEVWILTMYRPYFGNSSIFAEPVLGNLMDRILQLEMDRRARERMNEMREVRGLIEEARGGVDVGFISGEELRLWRNWLLAALDKPFNWERIRFMARRISPSMDIEEVEQLCQGFLTSVPEALDSLYSKVSESRMSEYMDESVAQSTRVVEDYLA